MAHGSNLKGKSHPGLTAKRRSKARVSNIGEDGAASIPAQSCLVVNWNKERTNCLLDWLDQNPVDHHCLFSDLIAHAKAEGQKKVKVKGDKAVFHKKIAEVVFNIPKETSDLHAWYQGQSDKFVQSIVNYLSKCLLVNEVPLLTSSFRLGFKWAITTST